MSVRRLEDRPGTAKVTIADTGIGIPPEAHDRLFEPFSQAYGDTSRTYGGTGLGLAIAKRLVQLMGGELDFTSEIGRGSEFWFTLPLVEAKPQPFTAEDRPGPVQASGERRVLVVEDNPINQLLVRSQLARLGYEPVVVDTGDVALEKFPDLGADLVLMDWQLPGIDGLETTRRLRSWERTHSRPRTPVVAMTASALPGDRDLCLAAGMDDFIAKPVSIGTLGATVRRWLGASPGAEPAEGAPRGAQGAPSPPVVDPRALEVLSDELDDPALVATVVRTFLRELPGRVGWITDACAAGDRMRPGDDDPHPALDQRRRGRPQPRPGVRAPRTHLPRQPRLIRLGPLRPPGRRPGRLRGPRQRGRSAGRGCGGLTDRSVVLATIWGIQSRSSLRERSACSHASMR